MDYVFAAISDTLHFTIGFDNVQGFCLRLNLRQQALAGKLRGLRILSCCNKTFAEVCSSCVIMMYCHLIWLNVQNQKRMLPALR